MIYDIAGLRVDIRNKYDFADTFCREYLADDQSAPADIVAVASQEEFLAEKQRNPNFTDGYIENTCIYSDICRKMTLKDRFLLHAAVLEYKGNAYAFLGRSGTGKSTHTKLWLQGIDGVKMLNGDKPILHYTNGEMIVYGTPWMGKEALGYKGKAPLRGLCFLEQAQENDIRRLSVKEAARRLFPQILHPIQEKQTFNTLGFADALVKKIPSFLLRCTISTEAMQLSFNALTGELYV
ncbi:MAG: hypothetical protein E7355_00495 [Clostridiales bacterium]|nr:hypothetical protein [Clostridiales bacterium]